MKQFQTFTPHQITQLYNKIYSLLTKHYNTIPNNPPKIRITSAKSYCGLISSDRKTIYISTTQNDTINELIDTICHEIAHIVHWEHTKRHENLTTYMYNRVIRSNIIHEQITNK